MPLDYKEVKLSTPTAIEYIVDWLHSYTNINPENTLMFTGCSPFLNKFERIVDSERVQKYKNGSYTNLEISDSTLEEDMNDSYINDVNYFIKPAKTKEYKIKVESFIVYKKLPQIF